MHTSSQSSHVGSWIHECLMASAGTGKTHRLTSRYIRLLREDPQLDPGHMIALTFTRAAAGEFLERVMHRLSTAAQKEAQYEALERDTRPERVEATPFDPVALLRRILQAWPRLRLMTLDSFLQQIASAFAMELGLVPDFQLISESESREARRMALEGVFFKENENERQNLVFELRNAMLGKERGGLIEVLETWMQLYQPLWWVVDDEARWGNASMIWKTPPWWARDGKKFEEAKNRLEQALIAQGIGGSSRNVYQRLYQFVQEFEGRRAGDPLDPKASKFLLDKFEPLNLEDLKKGNLVIHFYKEHEIHPSVATALYDFLAALIKQEIEDQLSKTRSLGKILHYIEQIYHQKIRSQGRLTFDDFPRALVSSSDFNRDQIYYRLDQNLSHWMLDEFQDTSLIQWEVISPLVEEVIQDTEGQRTFFVVGDRKQSIYSWRGGDERVFSRLLDRHEGQLRLETMRESRRSCQEVLDLVNSIFTKDSLLKELLPVETFQRWEFEVHTPFQKDLRGFSAVLRPTSNFLNTLEEDLEFVQEDEGEESAVKGEKQSQKIGSVLLAAELIRKLDPMRHGWSCALLVRTNEQVKQTVETLRNVLPGYPILSGAKIQPAQHSPLNLSLFQLLKWIGHPGDEQARGMVESTPLGEALREAHALERLELSLTTTLYQDILEHGFADFLDEWGRRALERVGENNPFLEVRLQQLVEMANQYDLRGDRNLDRFLDEIEAQQIREESQNLSIQVMTVHASKGLDYDLVMLPLVENIPFDQTPKDLVHLFGTEDDDREAWSVMQFPVKAFWSFDEVLRQEVDRIRAVNLYDTLCTLYVALTRAKRANFVLLEPVGTKNSKLNERDLPQQVGDFLNRRLNLTPILSNDFLEGFPGVENLWQRGQPFWEMDESEE